MLTLSKLTFLVASLAIITLAILAPDMAPGSIWALDELRVAASGLDPQRSVLGAAHVERHLFPDLAVAMSAFAAVFLRITHSAADES